MSTYIIVASMSTHMSSRIAGHTLSANVYNRVWGVMQVRHTNKDGYEVLTAATYINTTQHQLQVLLHRFCCHLLQLGLTSKPNCYYTHARNYCMHDAMLQHHQNC